jgi:hypothetical protein
VIMTTFECICRSLVLLAPEHHHFVAARTNNTAPTLATLQKLIPNGRPWKITSARNGIGMLSSKMPVKNHLEQR